MKKLISAFAAMAVIASVLGFSLTAFIKEDNAKGCDKDGHRLVGLWKEYQAALSKDSPREMMKTLEKIKSEAKSKRLHWDFYDAATAKVSAASSVNWKQRKPLKDSLAAEILEYDEPIVTFIHNADEGNANLAFVKASESRLKAGRNEGFHRKLAASEEIKDILMRDIRDDYELALWILSLNASGSRFDEDAAKTLSECLGGRYPESQYLEYKCIVRAPYSERQKKLASFAEANQGKAIRLLALRDLLEHSRNEIDANGGTSEEYSNLLKKVREAEDERKSFKSGIDREIASKIEFFKNMDEELNSSVIEGLRAERDTVEILVRNIDALDLIVEADGKTSAAVLKSTVRNTVGSFHAIDTLRLALPRLNDGTYSVTAKSGKEKCSAQMVRQSLSIASRMDSEGLKVYLADALSGKPIEIADLAVYRSGNKVAEAENVKFDGFSPIPDKLAKIIAEQNNCLIEASLVDNDGYLLKSPQMYLRRAAEPAKEALSYGDCEIFTDKAAYRPGEVLKFKAVLYNVGDMGCSTLPEGKDVKAELFTPDGKAVLESSLKTNEYGSVAGEFLIPEGDRNGRFRLGISTEKISSSRYVTVDEFELPTYELLFDKVEEVYLAGDTVRLGGRVTSYSGHSLSSAKVGYSVNGSEKKPVRLDPDGSFRIEFPTSENAYSCRVAVTVSDATGETREFSRRVMLGKYFRFSISVRDRLDGSMSAGAMGYSEHAIVSDPSSKIKYEVSNSEGLPVSASVSYALKDEAGKTILEGKADSGGEVELALPLPGLYHLESKAVVVSVSGQEIEQAAKIDILRIADDAEVLDAGVENVFLLSGLSPEGRLRKGEGFALRIGTGAGPTWMVVELFGEGKRLLSKRLISLEGRPGQKGSLETIAFDKIDELPDAMFLHVMYFRNYRRYDFSRTIEVEEEAGKLPLTFSSFRDKALPGEHCVLTLDTGSDAEVLAAVFDKSSEAIAPNAWSRVPRSRHGAEYVAVESLCGTNMIYRPRNLSRALAKSAYSISYEAEDGVVESVAMNDSAPAMFATGAEDSGQEAAVRSDFSTSLAFSPFLRPDKEGRVTLEFDASDKLSTFVVQAYAHDKSMNDALARREMVVSMPVKVSVAEPEYLYRGDSLVLHATVSNASDKDVEGSVSLQLYASEEFKTETPFLTASKKVSVPAGASVPVAFNLQAGSSEVLGIKLVFSGDSFSDGIFAAIPVLEPDQTLTEAHSAVFCPGDDEEALLRKLQGSFTGMTHSGAVYSQRDVKTMILEALPEKAEPKGADVLSLMNALQVRRISESLGAHLEREMPDSELISKVIACRNADGGFGWFEGMASSQLITATILERVAAMSSAGIGLEDFDPAPSVLYLDTRQFVHDSSLPCWCGVLSYDEYMHVRSLYSSIPFNVAAETLSAKAEYRQNFKDFKQFASSYLVPSKRRGLNGRIMDKARRIGTLMNLICNDGGIALASAWGMKLNVTENFRKSLSADVASLLEYAVRHDDGGWYCPNAVMPYRGLLESELYAHSLLCGILSDNRLEIKTQGSAGPSEVADGIRLWMMIQKETQKWNDDPAYLEAIASVLSGSEQVLDTKVVTLSKTCRKPIPEAVSAGNGFKVEKIFSREVAGKPGEREAIAPGTTLHVGDKIVAEYRVWSKENRSFVKISAPREAAFRPAAQLSGRYGWLGSPLRAGRSFVMAPQGYRNVKADRTEYYFDVYPEEESVVLEEFFVTQEGKFIAPAVTVESLYAPHYRANDGFKGAVSSSSD